MKFSSWFACLLSGLFFLFAAAAIHAEESPKFVEGEIIVGFTSGASQAEIEAVESRNGLMLLANLSFIRARHYRIPEGADISKVIQQVRESPIVRYAEPNYVQQRQALPNDPGFSNQWYLQNTGQAANGVSGTAGIDINWLNATSIYSPTATVTVAVVDSGVALDHPEFDGSLWMNPNETINGLDDDGNGLRDDVYGWDFSSNDPLPFDAVGHGTLVASLVAARTNNSIGMAGTASNVRIMALKVGNPAGPWNVAASANAFIYAANNGARVVNFSAGTPAYSQALADAIQYLASKGVLLVVAAGNKGDSNDVMPVYPASYPLDNIISVAAIDQHGKLTSFSNYGVNTTHLAAPGTNIWGAGIKRNIRYLEEFTSAAGYTTTFLPGSLYPVQWSPGSDSFGAYVGVEPSNYLPFSYPILTSPPITLGQGSVLSITSHWAMIPGDFLAVEVSTDNFSTFTLKGLLACQTSPFCFANNNVGNFDVTEFDGLAVKLRFVLLPLTNASIGGIFRIDTLSISEVGVFSYDGTQYQFNNGTSFSAPLVTAVAAMLFAQRPDLSYRQVRQVILSSVTKTSELTNKVSSGGYLNAFAALSAAKALPISPETGVWWNPAENGRGFYIEENAAGTIFFGSYLYEPTGRATWYSSALTPNAGSFTGTLDSHHGGQTLTGAYTAPSTTIGAGGNVSLAFTDPTHGTINWAGGTTPIERFTFADNSNPPFFQPQSGAWWNPAESGRGFALEVNGSTVFLGGYMYDAAGNPTWYLSTGTLTGQTYQGVWTEFANGQSLGGPYVAPTLVNSAVGQVSITFSSPTAGIMTLPNGATIPITRFLF